MRILAVDPSFVLENNGFVLVDGPRELRLIKGGPREGGIVALGQYARQLCELYLPDYLALDYTLIFSYRRHRRGGKSLNLESLAKNRAAVEAIVSGSGLSPDRVICYFSPHHSDQKKIVKRVALGIMREIDPKIRNISEHQADAIKIGVWAWKIVELGLVENNTLGAHKRRAADKAALVRNYNKLRIQPLYERYCMTAQELSWHR